jgi:hypothetical protein
MQTIQEDSTLDIVVEEEQENVTVQTSSTALTAQASNRDPRRALLVSYIHRATVAVVERVNFKTLLKLF